MTDIIRFLEDTSPFLSVQMPLFSVIDICLFTFGLVLLDHQIVNDEVLTLHGILAHVVFQKLLHLVVFVQSDLFESYVRTDEMRKLIGRDLSQTFESCDLRVGSKVANRVKTLLLSITITGDEVAFQSGVCKT